MTVRHSFCRISAPRNHPLDRAPSAQRDRQPSLHSCMACCSTKNPSAYATHPVHWLKPYEGKEAQMKWNIWPLAIHGRYRSGSHFFYGSGYVCLSRSHSKSYFRSLSFVDQSQRSPSLAPLYLYSRGLFLYRALILTWRKQRTTFCRHCPRSLGKLRSSQQVSRVKPSKIMDPKDFLPQLSKHSRQ